MKNLFILSFLIITIIASLTSCEKTVTLDIEQTQPRIVIEGQVTDVNTKNFVKISRSTGFYNTGKTARITDATVRVEDNAGNTYDFVHYQGDHVDSVGYYFPEVPFSGVAGRTYKLTVIADGEMYEATDQLFRLVPLEKLEYRINENEMNDPEYPGRFFELLLFVKEPQDTRDYYLFKSYRNDSLKYMNDTDVYYADDELIGENIDGIPLPVFYGTGDKAGVEVYSLSRDAFVYYRDLQKLLNNDGGLFGTPPANPRSNLSNGALGLFQASAIQSGELQIE
jgi:hypothetical protein